MPRACARPARPSCTVSDEEIVAAWHQLATRRGALLRAVVGGRARRASAAAPSPASGVVVTITGHGLKDTESADRYAPPLEQVEADPDAIAAAARG